MKEQFIIRPQAFPLVQNNWPTVGKSIEIYPSSIFPGEYFISGISYGSPNHFNIIWKKGVSLNNGLLVVLKKDTGRFSGLTKRNVSPAIYMAGYFFHHTPYIEKKAILESDEEIDYKLPARSHTWGDYNGLIFCVVDIQKPERNWKKVKSNMITMLDEALIQPVDVTS